MLLLHVPQNLHFNSRPYVRSDWERTAVSDRLNQFQFTLLHEKRLYRIPRSDSSRNFNSRSYVRSDSKYVQNRIEKSYLLCENSQI